MRELCRERPRQSRGRRGVSQVSAARASVPRQRRGREMLGWGGVDNIHVADFPGNSSTLLTRQSTERDAASPAGKVERFVSGLFDKMASMKHPQRGVGGEKGECGTALQHEENPCKQPLLVKVWFCGGLATRHVSIRVCPAVGHAVTTLLFYCYTCRSQSNFK